MAKKKKYTPPQGRSIVVAAVRAMDTWKTKAYSVREDVTSREHEAHVREVSKVATAQPQRLHVLGTVFKYRPNG